MGTVKRMMMAVEDALGTDDPQVVQHRIDELLADVKSGRRPAPSLDEPIEDWIDRALGTIGPDPSHKVPDGQIKEKLMSTTSIVMQSEIAELMRREEEFKHAKIAIEAKVREGAVVEPGPLFAEIGHEKDRPSLSFTKIVDVLGKEAAEKMKAAPEMAPQMKDRFKYGVREEASVRKGPVF